MFWQESGLRITFPKPAYRTVIIGDFAPPIGKYIPNVTTNNICALGIGGIEMLKACKKSLLFATVLSLATTAFPISSFAAEQYNVSVSSVFMSAKLKEPTTLSPSKEYTALEVNDLLDVDVLIGGEKDSEATYYVLDKAVYDGLEDKSEEVVRDLTGFKTEELDGNFDIKDVVLVTYHTFSKDVPIKTNAPEGESDGRDKEPTERKEKKVMAAKDYSFVVTSSANEVAEYFKSDTWYESHENNVTWLYTLNEDGLINHLYTESTNLSKYIYDGVFYIPETVDGIPVLAIGSGIGKTFIPDDVHFTGVVIPSTVQVIDDKAFYQNKNVFSLVVPFTVSKIGNKAFFSSNVTALTANGGHVEVGDSAFANCRYLESVKLFGDYDIGNKSFDGGRHGSALESVILLGHGKLGNNAFSNNKLLANITFGEGMEAVVTEEDSFRGCPFDKDFETSIEQ